MLRYMLPFSLKVDQMDVYSETVSFKPIGPFLGQLYKHMPRLSHRTYTQEDPVVGLMPSFPILKFLLYKRLHIHIHPSPGTDNLVMSEHCQAAASSAIKTGWMFPSFRKLQAVRRNAAELSSLG